MRLLRLLLLLLLLVLLVLCPLGRCQVTMMVQKRQQQVVRMSTKWWIS